MTWMNEIHGAANPYWAANLFKPECEGWNYDSPAFDHIIPTYRPSRYIEVGVWKGMSAIRAARLLKYHRIPDPQVLCVDHWHGALWPRQQTGDELYGTFLANVRAAGLCNIIIPFRIDSLEAARFLLERNMSADVIYIDAEHAYDHVSADLVAWWEVLRPGGALFGDDYSDGFPDVVRAADEFAATRGLILDHRFPSKFIIEKP